MSDESSLMSLRAGAHASVTDRSSTPTLVDLLLDDGWDKFGSPDTKPIKREPAHPLGKRYASLRGPIDVTKAIPLGFQLFGCNGNNGGAFSFATANDLAAAGIWQALFGAAAVDAAGAATTSTAGAGNTTTLTVTEQARFPVGIGVIVPTDQGTFLRQVVARAGSSGAGNLTLDRKVPGVLVTGTVIRSARHFVDPSIHDHIHMFFRAEWENFRRDFKGCMSLGKLKFPVGDRAMLDTSWMFTDVADNAEANPTITDPTRGGGLVTVNNSFWIGDTAFYATDIEVDLGGAMSARKANSGPHGVDGYPIAKGATTPRPTISVTYQRGVNAGEIADSTGTPSVNSLQGYALNPGDAYADFDLAFAVGNVAGSAMYIRAPNAHRSSIEDVTVDGRQHIKAVFDCDGPSSSSFYPLEALFF